MRKFPLTPSSLRRRAVALGAVGLALTASAALPSAASANRTQIAMFQDYSETTTPVQTLQAIRALGGNTIRVLVPWQAIAPNPRSTHKPSFNASDPNAYPAANWAPFDTLVQTAINDGLRVDLMPAGAPRWAEGRDIPVNYVKNSTWTWKPSPTMYGQFFHALAERYSGHFTPTGASSPLPAIHFWAIWNEPNFGEDLGPQAIDGSKVMWSPTMYRGLLNAGWTALRQTGHAHDTILIGEVAAYGLQGPVTRSWPQGLPGNGALMKPLIFLRWLYCVDGTYHPLRGSVARTVGCPTNAAGTRAFRAKNPALFGASGFSDHPYGNTGSPVSTRNNDPNYATFPDLGNLESVLDRVNRVYRSSKRFPIYNTEYGYITNPPHGGGYPSPGTAAAYINQAEYISWKSPRISSYMQYLLSDPPSSAGIYALFASGLEYSNGKPKADYYAYRMPVFMPTTSFAAGSSQEVWGAARPAPFAIKDGAGPQSVQIQVNRTTIATVAANGPGGYFDTRIRFPHSGSVRLAWTYPANDPMLPFADQGTTVYSRSVNVSAH